MLVIVQRRREARGKENIKFVQILRQTSDPKWVINPILKVGFAEF